MQSNQSSSASLATNVQSNKSSSASDLRKKVKIVLKGSMSKFLDVEVKSVALLFAVATSSGRGSCCVLRYVFQPKISAIGAYGTGLRG